MRSIISLGVGFDGISRIKGPCESGDALHRTLIKYEWFCYVITHPWVLFWFTFKRPGQVSIVRGPSILPYIINWHWNKMVETEGGTNICNVGKSAAPRLQNIRVELKC